MKTVGQCIDGSGAVCVLECPQRLPHFVPCCIDGVVCADAILHSEQEDGHGAGCQGIKGPEVIIFPFHGGPNQLWEYRNRLIYRRLNE